MSARGARQAALAAFLACVMAAPAVTCAHAADIATLTRQIEAALDADRPQDAEVAALAALADAPADSVETANLHRLLGDAIFNQQRYVDAEPHYRIAAEMRERLLGVMNADTAVSLNDLAIVLRRQQRFDEALPLYEKVLEIREAVLGPDAADTARSTFWVARLLESNDRLAEAATVMGLAVERAGVAFGPRDTTVAQWMGERAAMLHNSGDIAAAEPVYVEAITLGELVLPPDDDFLAAARHGLGNLYNSTGRVRDAIPLYRLALAGREAAYGPDDRDTISSADRLARALYSVEEIDEARELFVRVLAAREATDGADSPAAADALRWIGRAASARGRYTEAEIVFKRVIAISEAQLGRDHILTGFDLIALGQLFSAQERFTEARPLLERGLEVLANSPDAGNTVNAARAALSFVERATGNTGRAIEITEQALADTIANEGPKARATADITFMLGTYYRDTGNLEKGEQLVSSARDLYSEIAPASRSHFRVISELGRIREEQGRYDEALALHRQSYAGVLAQGGADSAELRPVLADLGDTLFATGDYAGAAAYFERATAIVERLAAIDAVAAFASRVGDQEDRAISSARAFDGLVKAHYRMSGKAEDAFLVAQRVTESDAAKALAQMAARQASGSGDLALLVRERQDLVAQWRADDSALTLALASEGETVDLRARLAATDARISAIDAQLATGFPAFAELQRPAPLDVEGVQARLGANDVLLFYADTGAIASTADETFLWLVPKTGDVKWFKVPRTTGELRAAIHAMREDMGVGAATRGPKSLAGNGAQGREARVLKAASELHTALLGEASELIAGRNLLIVPSRSLASVPFHALVDGKAESYADAHWMARDHAITILPAVSALGAAPSADDAQRVPYLAFANPLLTGGSGADLRAFERTGCETIAPSVQIADLEAQPSLDALFRGAAADVTAVRALVPLPETTDEACAIAAALGADADAVHLGAEATEAAIKSLSASGRLAGARVLHFATHALVSGELGGLTEPAIVLTPPEAATIDDDGLLTASEVTTLKLDADWVILSACNTASSDGGGEALSGLARAFFYAGARALMVSHWPVNSDSAVRLATGAVDSLQADPSISRAEALRRAMVAEIDRGGEAADPANWAPFIVVGS